MTPPRSGKTLEQLAQRFDLAIENIPVEQIDPDEQNANEMDAGLYETLVDDIREHGFTQPILVRPVGDRYRLIDGEHRWRAVSEIGIATIPAIVLEVSDEDDATLRLLTMNRLRGQFVPIKLAYVIADLARRIPEKELRSRLGMEPGEFEDKLRLANFRDTVGERVKAQESKARKGRKVVLRFSCSKPDGDLITRVVDALVDAKMDRGEALAQICREFERANRVEGTTRIGG